MKKINFIIIGIFLFVNTAKCQSISDKDLSELRRFFIENVLVTETAASGKAIMTPMNINELLGIVHERPTMFLSRLIQYSRSGDSGYLNNLIRNAPIFEAPQNYQSDRFIYLDSTTRRREEIQKYKMKYNWPSYIWISNFLLINNNQTCLVFIHVYEGAGISIELRKDQNNKWVLFDKKTEWLE